MNENKLFTTSGIRPLIRPALCSAVLFMLVAGLAYPLLTTLTAGVLFPDRAAGSLVARHGVAVGSALIGQTFTAPQYFHPRPSATADAPYNAASSGASNKGPTNADLIDQVEQRAQAYRRDNGLDAAAPVPVDAVTASASGLDPDISIANARLQAARVGKARAMRTEDILSLVARYTTARQLDLLGESRVNVLMLNLALDDLPAARPQ